jgi:hypothetical protein
VSRKNEVPFVPLFAAGSLVSQQTVNFEWQAHCINPGVPFSTTRIAEGFNAHRQFTIDISLDTPAWPQVPSTAVPQ